jgi:WD40 repeat protein
MHMWDINGDELYSWKGAEMPRVNDLAISAAGTHMVSICNETEIRIYSFEDKSEHIISEVSSITSLAMSADGSCLLVNLSSGAIHLWDNIQSPKPPTAPAFEYKGQQQGKFVIRSCFGGSGQAFIVSGSEDSQVYIWHRTSGEKVKVLSGHSGTVNAVCWNPSNPHMFASASDDRTVRLWGLPDPTGCV